MASDKKNSRLERYKALRIRRAEEPGSERIDSKRMRARDGSIILARQEAEEPSSDIVLDMGNITMSEDDFPAGIATIPTTAKPRKRKQKVVTTPTPTKPSELVSIEKGGMTINAYFDMVLDTPELIVVRGSRPLAVEPKVSADEPEAYVLTVKGRTYNCLYAGITYCETQDSQTVVFHKA